MRRTGVRRAVWIALLLAGCQAKEKTTNTVAALPQARFTLDRVASDTGLLQQERIDSLYLVLDQDGSYHFEPRQNSLYPFEGRWKREHSGFYEFELNNGEKQKNKNLFISLPSFERDSRLSFKLP
jgi:hypothetical protein